MPTDNDTLEAMNTLSTLCRIIKDQVSLKKWLIFRLGQRNTRWPGTTCKAWKQKVQVPYRKDTMMEEYQRDSGAN